MNTVMYVIVTILVAHLINKTESCSHNPLTEMSQEFQIIKFISSSLCAYMHVNVEIHIVFAAGGTAGNVINIFLIKDAFLPSHPSSY